VAGGFIVASNDQHLGADRSTPSKQGVANRQHLMIVISLWHLSHLLMGGFGMTFRFDVRAVFAKSSAGVAALLVCGLMLAGNAHAQVQAPEGCYPLPEVRPLSVTQPLNIDLIKQQLIHYRCTRYDAEVAAVVADAQAWIHMRAPQVGNPAIVLDIDETSLSNWTRILRDDFGYIPNGTCDLKAGEACGDIAWQQSAQAPALQPTLDLFGFAKCATVPPTQNCIKVAVFFVTGRYQQADAQAWTELNLTNAGYRGWDRLYMRDPATYAGPRDPGTTGVRAQDQGAHRH
jgi:acid phosphatase